MECATAVHELAAGRLLAVSERGFVSPVHPALCSVTVSLSCTERCPGPVIADPHCSRLRGVPDLSLQPLDYQIDVPRCRFQCTVLL